MGVGVGVFDEIKAISAPSWDLAWAWAELGKKRVHQHFTLARVGLHTTAD